MVGMAYRKHLTAKVVNFERETGIVIDNVIEADDVYRPVIEYFVGGHRYSITSNVGYGRKKGGGTKMTVMHDPNNPAKSFVVEDYYFAANSMLAIGGCFIFFGSLISYFFLFRNEEWANTSPTLSLKTTSWLAMLLPPGRSC